MADIRPPRDGDEQEPPVTPPGDERSSQQSPDLDLRVERKSEKHVVLHVMHDFTSQSCYLFDEAFGRLMPAVPGLRVEVDVSQVPYADSAALGRLIFWSKRFVQAGATFVVLNPPPYLASIMDIMHFDEAVTTMRRHVTPPPDNV